METTTMNGVTYTPVDENAALVQDAEGNVTGISAGTVEVTLEDSTDPKITLDGSTPFNFTASAENGSLKIAQDSNYFNFVSGNATYSASGISLSEGANLNKTFDDGTSLTIAANTDEGGTITFNSEGGLSVTPASEDSLTVNIEFGDNRYIKTNNIEGTVDLTDSTFTFADGVAVSGVWNLTGNEEETFNLKVSDGTATLAATENALIFTANEGATFVNKFGENESFTISNGSVSVSADGTFTSTVPAGTVLTDTNSNYPYILQTAGTYSLNGKEITTTADGVKVSLTNNDTVSFDAGAAVAFDGFTFNGEGTVSISENALSLNEGSSLNKTFDDGTQLTVTANADAENAITYDSESGIEIAPETADALSISIKDTNSIEIFNITSIKGTLNYSDDDVLTFADGTEIELTVYKEIPGKLSSTGGTSTVKFESDRATYTANDGATFTVALDNGETSTLKNGSVIDAWNSKYAIITAGTTLTSNISNATTASGVELSFEKYILETAGTYTLNGNEIKTTAANAEVSLTNNDTVSFDADAGVTFGNHTFNGDGTVQIANGEVEVVMTEQGTATLDGKKFTLSEATADGVTIKPTDSGFEASHVVTAAEVSNSGEVRGLTESDIGKTLTETVEISNDNDYSVTLVPTGFISIDGISNQAVVKANAKLDGETFAGGAILNIKTDSTGTITLNDKSYTITGDNQVGFYGSFANDSFAINSLELLDNGGAVSGNFNGLTEIQASFNPERREQCKNFRFFKQRNYFRRCKRLFSWYEKQRLR